MVIIQLEGVVPPADYINLYLMKLLINCLLRQHLLLYIGINQVEYRLNFLHDDTDAVLKLIEIYNNMKIDKLIINLLAKDCHVQ